MKIDIAMSNENRAGVVQILNTLLADEYLLYTRTRNYHWNVVGRQFNDLHKFFEAQYEEIDGVIDDVAERSRALGLHSAATMTEFMQLTRLKEKPADYPAALDMVGDLLADHEAIIRTLRADLVTCMEKFHDAGSSDFLTGLMEKHEKMAWMLRSFREE
jgi:starvation-inducible DNA-binding protein